MLHVNDLTYRIGGRVLFERATVHIPSGQRVGLIGRNGSGKSTLLKLILGELPCDGGEISIRPRARVGHVAQEAPADRTSLLDCVLAADTELRALTGELETTADGHRIAELHERLNAIDGHAAPARAGAILTGLGFPARDHGNAVGDYSGGWRMRVALAGALFANPELLLLDEPTNHLDLEASLWLENYLATYPGTLLIISHDRDLLNKVCQRIVHIEQGRLNAYQGDYDTFEKTRRERIDLQAKALTKQLEQRRQVMDFVNRFRAKASKARQAQSRLKLLEKMPPVVPVIEDHAVVFDFPSPEPLSPPLIAIEDGVAGYDGKAVLRGLSLRIDMDDRIALLGANGNGKSTLSKVLAGRLPLLEGRSRQSQKLRIGYFAQHQTEELDSSGTPLGHMQALMPLVIEAKVRAHLGRFGFGEDKAEVKIANLSGGEKARLLFALMSREAPHLMILDEPTNHLDIDTREALVAALNAYDGAVVLVSHDPRLIELTADRLWLVDGGACEPFDGDMADYRRLLLDRARAARTAEGAPSRATTTPDSAPSRKDERRAAAQAREQLAPLRKAIKQAEAEIARHETEKRRIEALLADPSLYDGPPAAVAELRRALARTVEAIDEAEGQWMKASETLDAATR